MEIKINLNIDLANFNQIIDKLSTLYTKASYIEPQIPSREEHPELIEPIQNNTKASATNIDLKKVREAMGQLINNGKFALTKELLQKYNAKSINEVKIEDYENLYHEVIKYIN